MTPERDPFNNYTFITYVWVAGLSMWGGLVSFIRKVKEGSTHMFSIRELLGELVTSAFAGIMTFWLCEAAQMNPLITAALVGISGHMGSRTIYKIEKWATSKFEVIGVKDED